MQSETKYALDRNQLDLRGQNRAEQLFITALQSEKSTNRTRTRTDMGRGRTAGGPTAPAVGD